MKDGLLGQLLHCDGPFSAKKLRKGIDYESRLIQESARIWQYRVARWPQGHPVLVTASRRGYFSEYNLLSSALLIQGEEPHQARMFLGYVVALVAFREPFGEVEGFESSSVRSLLNTSFDSCSSRHASIHAAGSGAREK